MTESREREEAMMREVLRFAIEPPAPGLADRVLATVAEHAERSRRDRQPRTHWAVGLVAVALTAALVLTLLLGGRLARQPSAPANHGVGQEAGDGAIPVRAGAVRPFLTSAAGGWLAQRTGAQTTLYQAAGDGLTWTPRLAYTGGLPSQVVVGAGGAGVVVGAPSDSASADLVLFRTSDGGATWQRVPAPVSGASWGAPYFVDAARGWVLASLGPGAALIASTTDAGLTWSTSPTFNDRANFPGLSSVRLRIAWTADGRGIAVPPLGSDAMPVHVFITGDGGATWRSSFPGPVPGQHVTAATAVLDASLRSGGAGALFLQPLDARGQPAGLYAYSTGDAGRTWAQPARIDGSSGGASRVLFALDGAHWWASADSGSSLLVTSDGGRTIRRRGGLPAGYAFQSLGFWSPGDGWAVGAARGGTAVFVTHDAGASWQPLNPP